MWAEPGMTLRYARDQSATPILRDRFFDGLGQVGVKTVTVVVGATDYCVRWAIEGLIARGFKVELRASLTRGIAKTAEEAAKDWFSDKALDLAD